MAARRKSAKEKALDGAIKMASCGIMLAIVLIMIQMFSGFVETKLMAQSEAIKPENTPLVEETEVMDTEEEQTQFTVCVDAGHGGKDNGCDYKGRYEKDDNLTLALALQKYLESQNVQVVMTRDDDTFLKLSARCRVSNNAKADYYISLHRNKGEGYGIESWIYSNANEESVSLAENIMKGLDTVGISRNRGVSYGTSEGNGSDYYVNSHSNAPSLILEMGFINSTQDNSLLDEQTEAYAKAIGDAIIQTYQAYQQDKRTGDSNGL